MGRLHRRFWRLSTTLSRWSRQVRGRHRDAIPATRGGRPVCFTLQAPLAFDNAEHTRESDEAWGDPIDRPCRAHPQRAGERRPAYLASRPGASAARGVTSRWAPERRGRRGCGFGPASPPRASQCRRRPRPFAAPRSDPLAGRCGRGGERRGRRRPSRSCRRARRSRTRGDTWAASAGLAIPMTKRTTHAARQGLPAHEWDFCRRSASTSPVRPNGRSRSCCGR